MSKVYLFVLFLLLIAVAIVFFPQKSLAQSNTPMVKVLVLSYFPSDPNRPTYLDPRYVGTDLSQVSLQQIQEKITRISSAAFSSLTEATKYKGYSNTSAEPSIVYVQQGNHIIKNEPIPKSTNSAGEAAFYPDYNKILTENNICDMVDNHGLNQVWIWGYHTDDIVPLESNMSMGTDVREFWNHDGYGDVSNSYQTNDLPQCNKTYVVYNYNYGRDLGEVLEDHTHQLERYFNHLTQRNIPADKPNESLFWNLFVGAQNNQPNATTPGCGWTHFPPNGSKDYDWYKTTPVQSDCMDWKPDHSGSKTAVSCNTWGGCAEDGGVKFKVWWMQNIPGKANTLTHQGKKLKNWWKAVYDFDDMLKEGGGLLEQAEAAVITPLPAPQVENWCFPTDIGNNQTLFSPYIWISLTDASKIKKVTVSTTPNFTTFWEATLPTEEMVRRYPNYPSGSNIELYAPRDFHDANGTELALLKDKTTYYLQYANDSETGPVTTITTERCDSGDDFNLDGKLDDKDFEIIKKDFGKTGAAGFSRTDIIKNGVVDIYDYNFFLQQYIPR